MLIALKRSRMELIFESCDPMPNLAINRSSSKSLAYWVLTSATENALRSCGGALRQYAALASDTAVRAVLRWKCSFSGLRVIPVQELNLKAALVSVQYFSAIYARISAGIDLRGFDQPLSVQMVFDYNLSVVLPRLYIYRGLVSSPSPAVCLPLLGTKQGANVIARCCPSCCEAPSALNSSQPKGGAKFFRQVSSRFSPRRERLVKLYRPRTASHNGNKCSINGYCQRVFVEVFRNICSVSALTLIGAKLV